ncbi:MULTISPECIES: FAD-dependent oxidoreductase [unclassified Nocardia]|uniref:NAD(P)/FAD-dependent oxidoreductase n=1 Tax=unclassified Nocardia TaxID=2637762 RepID=UPI001CE4B2AC|nr:MULTISPECIES: FAD-dependent oxidoreductase [unclassified Nocardia]
MTHRIVVLGAGYAGLNAAARAARLLRGRDIRLTLINRTDRFVERIRLHQLAAGQELPDRPLRRLLAGTAVELTVATVTGIDLENRIVRTDSAPVGYDTLIYALGSDADLDAVPGVREHAYSVAERTQALRLREKLCGLDGSVVVVGGGLTGIEAATEIAQAYPRLRVELVSSAPVGGWLSERAQRHLRKSFADKGISVMEEVCVAKVGPDGLVTEDGRTVPADLIVWAAGFQVPELARAAGLATDARGRLLVDDRLRSISHPEVYGVGDAAGDGVRMSCQTGMQMGPYVAQEIARALRGRKSKPIVLRYFWQNISLGRGDGVTQFTRFDDSPTGLVLTGRASAWFKELISRGAMWAVRR